MTFAAEQLSSPAELMESAGRSLADLPNSTEKYRKEQMATSMQGYSTETKVNGSSRVAGVLRRAPLVMVTVIFTLISFRYLSDPVRAAAAAGIAFTSPGGVTVARVGFAAFPLSFAILAFSCLISPRRLLVGLYMVLTVVVVVTAIRIFGIVLDHSASESARLLVPESVLMALSVIAIRLESSRRRREGKVGA